MNRTGKLAMAALIISGSLVAGAAGAIVELPAGPYLRFSEEGQATVYWQTDTAVASVVQYGMRPALDKQHFDSAPKTDHELTIGLRPETQYDYRVVVGSDSRLNIKLKGVISISVN